MTTQKIMGLVLLALLPAAVCGVIFFGIRALLLMLFCILIFDGDRSHLPEAHEKACNHF